MMDGAPARSKFPTMRDRLYVHIVWTTRGREPTIDATVARFLTRFLPAVARQARAGLHAVGIVRTHIHLLLQLHPTTNISRLLQRLKGGSSVLANREGHAARPLRWARGYNIEFGEPTRARGCAGVRAAAADAPSPGGDTRVERGGGRSSRLKPRLGYLSLRVTQLCRFMRQIAESRPAGVL